MPPGKVMSIDSVKINPSLVMMREWKIIMLMLFSMLLMSSFAGNHKNYTGANDDKKLQL